MVKKIENLYLETKDKKAYKSLYQLYIKRVIDFFICIISLPIFIFLFFPISIAIKLEDGGPIFYKSKRIGINFTEFEMYKFRTMKVDAPDIRNGDGSTYNSENDCRVTKVGKFLRKSSLDETPQILNVIKGDMYIAGPRPGDIESKFTYCEDEKDKMLLKPGITGYTQAYFRNNLSVREKRMMDAWYSHNVSFILDIKIILKTIVSVIKSENIYTNI